MDELDEAIRLDPGILVMEMAPGRPFDRILGEQMYCPIKNYPLIDWYSAVSSYLECFEMWLQVGLDKNIRTRPAFFHGDPHLGNLFWCDESKKFSMIDFGNSYEVFAKDFPNGMGGYMYEMLHGALLKDPDRILKLYPFKPEVPQDQRQALREKLILASEEVF